MAEIVWNNGQGEFDFDYLLNLTDANFVDVVSFALGSEHFKSVKVQVEQDCINAIVVTKFSVSIYTYNRFMKKYHVSFLDNDTLIWAINNSEVIL